MLRVDPTSGPLISSLNTNSPLQFLGVGLVDRDKNDQPSIFKVDRNKCYALKNKWVDVENGKNGLEMERKSEMLLLSI